MNSIDKNQFSAEDHFEINKEFNKRRPCEEHLPENLRDLLMDELVEIDAKIKNVETLPLDAKHREKLLCVFKEMRADLIKSLNNVDNSGGNL
jgi:hypothetical protein